MGAGTLTDAYINLRKMQTRQIRSCSTREIAESDALAYLPLPPFLSTLIRRVPSCAWVACAAHFTGVAPLPADSPVTKVAMWLVRAQTRYLLRVRGRTIKMETRRGNVDRQATQCTIDDVKRSKTTEAPDTARERLANC
jgi:hypothetical protein